MSCILYCIFPNPKQRWLGTLFGVNAQRISLISYKGISGAISQNIDPALRPDASTILAYHNVIQAFHDDTSISGVIPMRYGAFFENASQVKRQLEVRHSDYGELLKELAECVEMGIRIILTDSDTGPKDIGLSSNRFNRKRWMSLAEKPKNSGTGKCYLEARRGLYNRADQYAAELDKVSDTCRSLFDGLYTKSRTERPSDSFGFPSLLGAKSAIKGSGAPVEHMISLYFLVPRKSVESFRLVFRQVAEKVTSKCLLSGPWPPYNFVLSDSSGKTDHSLTF